MKFVAIADSLEKYVDLVLPNGEVGKHGEE